MMLREWCSATVVASYRPSEQPVVWQSVLRYLAWLDSLPVGPSRARVKPVL